MVLMMLLRMCSRKTGSSGMEDIVRRLAIVHPCRNRMVHFRAGLLRLGMHKLAVLGLVVVEVGWIHLRWWERKLLLTWERYGHLWRNIRSRRGGWYVSRRIGIVPWADRRCLSVKLDEGTTTFTLYAFGYGNINQQKFWN